MFSTIVIGECYCIWHRIELFLCPPGSILYTLIYYFCCSFSILIPFLSLAVPLTYWNHSLLITSLSLSSPFPLHPFVLLWYMGYSTCTCIRVTNGVHIHNRCFHSLIQYLVQFLYYFYFFAIFLIFSLYLHSAVCPYLALETCRQWRLSNKTVNLMRNGKMPTVTIEQAQKNFCKVLVCAGPMFFRCLLLLILFFYPCLYESCFLLAGFIFSFLLLVKINNYL